MNHYTDEQLEKLRSKLDYGDIKNVASREGITPEYLRNILKGKIPQAPAHSTGLKRSEATALYAIEATILWIRMKELFVSKDIGSLDDLNKLQS